MENPAWGEPWPVGTQLVLASGTSFGTVASVPLSDPLPPRARADVSVPLTAPLAPGSYSSEWRFVAPDGTTFGDALMCHVDVLVAPAPAVPVQPPVPVLAPAPSLATATAPAPSADLGPRVDRTVDALALVDATMDDVDFEAGMTSLIAMGFANRARNLALLRAYRGNLNAVTQSLLSETDNDWHRRPR